ncbi:MAG: hypothetical protein IPJ32_07520 [Sphingobacteriaceae bacterium]|nr:hypothetical protein [Sphingobacteriaceae bacterium]
MFRKQMPFEFYITYIPIIVLLFFFIAKYKFPRELLFILIPLMLTGLLNVFIDNNTFGNFFKIFVNVAINIVFYRYVMEYYDYDVNKMFKMYLAGSYIVAILGLIQVFSFIIHFYPGYYWRVFLPLNKWNWHEGGLLGIRLNSTFTEPSYFGSSIAPAFFIALYELVFNRQVFLTRIKCVVIIVAYLLTFSSLAYIGIFVTILLFALNFGALRYFFIAIPVALIMYNFAYVNVKDFSSRIDGMNALFIEGVVETELGGEMSRATRMIKVGKVLQKVHGSSFVLYNNLHVAYSNFKQNPLMGSGLGSPELAFQQYNLNRMMGGIYEFNAPDANSMFLRIMSELGIMGIFFVFVFIFKYYVSKSLNTDEDPIYWLTSNAILVIIITQLLRQGNYTYNGFILFIWMYYYNWVRYTAYVEKKREEEIKLEEIEMAKLN